jgi:hypothetical protein
MISVAFSRLSREYWFFRGEEGRDVVNFSMCDDTRELRFTVLTVDCGRGNRLVVVDLANGLEAEVPVSWLWTGAGGNVVERGLRTGDFSRLAGLET